MLTLLALVFWLTAMASLVTNTMSIINNGYHRVVYFHCVKDSSTIVQLSSSVDLYDLP